MSVIVLLSEREGMGTGGKAVTGPLDPAFCLSLRVPACASPSESVVANHRDSEWNVR